MVGPYHKNEKYNSVALLLGYNQRGAQFPSHVFSTYFVHICKVSLVLMGNT